MNYKYQWKYSDEERPECRCYDCGLEYGKYPDLALPHWLWELINPSYHKGAGLLCPNCLANRLDYLGLWYNYCSDAIFFQVRSIIRLRRLIFDYWCYITYPVKNWIWIHYYKDKI